MIVFVVMIVVSLVCIVATLKLGKMLEQAAYNYPPASEQLMLHAPGESDSEIVERMIAMSERPGRGPQIDLFRDSTP